MVEISDPFVALSPHELALLTDEQMQVAREAAENHHPATTAQDRAREARVLDACAAEAVRLRRAQ